MPLRREKIDISVERRVLSNLIMSTTLLGRCRKVGDPTLFETTLGKIVSTWVWDFYDKCGEAPKGAISDLYRQRASELKDADAEMVYTFLQSCSDEWLPTNEGMAEEMALKFFQGRSLAVLSDRLSRAVQANDVSGGFHAIADFVKPEIRKTEVVDMFGDVEAVSSAFDDEEDVVFEMPGELGRVIGPFIREDFVAVIGPPKSSKTWWLMVIAMQAALQGKAVLFVSLEMSKKQMVRRFWQMLQGRSRYGEEAPWPEFQECDEGVFRIVDGVATTRRVDVSDERIAKDMRDLRKMSRGGRLELRNYPTNSLTVRGLQAELKDMEVYENFVPEVIVVDYADIMDLGRGDSERDRINTTWKGLRGLASERKGVLVTASQTGRQTVGGNKDVGAADVAEDIRKVAHVTKLITLNHSMEEKARGICRVACETSRDGAPCIDQVVCTSCLAIGRPYLDFKLLSRVDMGQEEEYHDEEQEERAPRRGSPRRRR